MPTGPASHGDSDHPTSAAWTGKACAREPRILAITGVLLVLLMLGAAAAVQAARSIGWSPGASIIHVIGNAMLS